MQKITNMCLTHKENIAGSICISLAIFTGILVASHFGIGGIRVNPWLLFLGFTLAEAGDALTYFGEIHRNKRHEYCGVTMKGIAWWVWCFNLGYFQTTDGIELILGLAVGFTLLVGSPVVLHFLRKEVLAGLRERARVRRDNRK